MIKIDILRTVLYNDSIMKTNYIELNENFITNPIAHRGLHSNTVSENSMQAFSLAIEKGYAIEIDIHLMKDGELVVVHDTNLKRVTGIDFEVKDLTTDTLKNYPLTLNGEKIPTFKEFLSLVDGKVPVLIEIKANSGFDPKTCEKLLLDLKNYGAKDKIALQSFNPYVVKYLKTYSQDYSVGLLATKEYPFKFFTNYILRNLKLYKKIHADFISYNVAYLPFKKVSKIKKRGHKVLAWTINSPERLQNARKYADNVIFEKIDL